jgi:demethylspheroidene O-methyltransferase
VSWSDRFSAWRESLTARPGFRAWAARFPLTRPLARRRARELFDLCAGFVYSQVLAACVRLKLFEALHEAPAEEGALAARLGLSPEAMSRLLVAAESLRLVRRRADGAWALGELGAAMIGNPGIAAMVVQFGLAMMPLGSFTPRTSRSKLTSLTTNGTSTSLRQAEELSITTAPAAAKRGACTRDMVAPAENNAMSKPRGSAVSASSTSIS